MIRTFSLAAALAILTLTVSAVEAKTKWSESCKADLTKFCKDVGKGKGRKACLRTHAAELAAECTQALKDDDEAKANKKT